MKEILGKYLLNKIKTFYLIYIRVLILIKNQHYESFAKPLH